jgi:hypothetical protein
MDVSTGTILAAVDAAPAAEVLVLPNDPNVVTAAEQAVAAASLPARVLPTESLVAGLGALVAYEPLRPAEENAAEMAAAAAGVRTGVVTVTSRSDAGGAVEFVGLVDGERVAAGTSLDRVETAVARRIAPGAAVVTILVGEDAPPPEALVEALRAADDALEIEIHAGGQPHDLYLLGAE